MNRKLYLWLLTLVLAVILSNTTQAQRFQVILGPGQIAENQSCWPQPLVHDYEAVWMQNTGIPKYAIGFCIDAHKKRPDVNGSYYDFANATYCGGDHGCYGPFLAYVNTGHAGETVDMCGSSAGRQNMGICVISPDNLANKTICQGQSVVLQGSCLKGTLRWFDSNGGNFANGNPTVAPGSTTTYYATCYSTFGASGSYYAPYANVPCETPRVPVTVTVNPKPAAPPNPGWKTICTGESVTLSSSCSGSSIRWMKDGGSVIGTSNSITVNPTVTNTAYYAQCVGSNGCGSDIIGLRVVVNPRAAAPVTTPMSVCPGETITLPGTCSSAGSSIEWYSDSNLSTRISNTIKPSATATYYARCFDSKGCHSPTSSVVVTMKAGGVSLSQSDFTKTDATSCTSPNGTIKICNLIQNVSYTVKFNKNNRPQTPQTLTADGSGCITLVGLSEATYDNFNVTNNGSGCSSGPLYGVSLTVLNTAKPTFTAIAHTPAVCGEAGYIDISGLTPGSLYTVSYKKDGVAQHPFSFSADSTGFRWDDPGAGSFVITLTNGFCVSNTMTVVLGDGPQPFNISAYPYNPTVCQGTDGKIYVQGLGSPKTYTMYYSKDGVPQTPITFDNPVGSPVGRMIDGLTAGTYTIKLKDTQACSSNETTVTLYDVGAPRIDILALSYPGACGDSTGAITITGLAPGKTYTILYSKNGIEQTPLTYTATSDRNYTISTLTSGVYSNIHIIDQNCESNRLSATLDDPGNLNIMLGAVVQPTGCGQANGSITIKGLINGQQYQLFYVKDGVTVSGGTFTATGFTYTINSLGSGAYTGIVVKQGVCSSNALTASLFGPGVTLIQARAVNTSTCAGTDGQIIITGLTAGVNYTLNYAKNGVAQPAVSITPTSSSYTISNLTAGDYTDISVTQSSCTSNKVNVSIKDPAGPEAPVASGATICAGTSATLTATCKTGTLKWYSNSSLSTEVTSTTVSPAATTTYYAVCVTNQCKSAGTPAVITVTPGVQKPTVNSPLAICLNDSTTLSANCAAGTLKWFSDSTLTIELSNTKISPQSDTTFYAICSTAQCSSATSKLKITVNPLPQFTVALGTCDAQTQTYSATVTMPAGATLSSTKGTVAGNTISGIPSDVLTTIKVTSAAGCMNQTEIYQHCKPVCNPPTPVIANSSVTICAKDSVVLTATGCGSNYGYEWSTDYSLASYKVAPSTTTTYFVHCKGEAGCVSKDSAVVTVTVKPRPTITLGTPQCAANRTYSVSVTATAGAVITSSSGTVSGNNVTGIPSGTTATITATLNGCSASKDTTFTCAGVFDLALRKVLPNGAKNPTVLPGSTVTFNIKVYNQGNVDATNVSLVDYIPAGLTLADASWTAAGSNATLNTPIASLVAGDSVMVPIKFTVNAGFTGNIRNFAEISGANNTNNLNDIDSTPDSNPSNDGTPKDDVVNEDHKNNPTQDEDDHDYEDINVACVKPVAGTDQNICSPATTASLTGFSPAGGTWSAQTGNPAAAIVTNAGAVSGMSAVGTYKFIYSLNGCSDTVSVIIKPKPVAGADQSICAPATTASLTGFSPAGGTWSAQTGNPASATVTNAGAVSGMSAAGTYKFIYTLNGCSDTVSVIIKPKPVAGADQSLACANASTNTLQTTTSLTGFSP
ncbi:conserved repeat domain-containing protein, partial [Pseudarcicella hirudinis]